jgi:hypothetical protein
LVDRDSRTFEFFCKFFETINFCKKKRCKVRAKLRMVSQVVAKDCASIPALNSPEKISIESLRG